MEFTDEQRSSIDEARSRTHTTHRPTVPALEDLLFQPMHVLDHGFIRVVDYMGDDAAVVQAARVSYGRGTKHVSEDRSLIRYLMRQWHSTPFEMAEIKLHVKLPIFVARQWIRHRTANVNEVSARYSILDKEFYVPERRHLAAQSSKNRQGRGEPLGEEEAEQVLKILEADALRNHGDYLWMLNETDQGGRADPDRQGVARELARINLTLNSYTQWYWKTDLHNLLGFLRLRADAHAQYEIRAYAELILSIVERWVPLTYEAFCDYRLEAVQFSKQQIDVIRQMIARKSVEREGSGLSTREWDELLAILKPSPI